jgi:xanthine/uracil permease
MVTTASETSTEVFDVGVNQSLPITQLLLLGLQNVFGMTGMFVFPGLLGRSFGLPLDQIAYLYAMTFGVCGFITCLQSVGLLRLPIVQGPYAGSFASLLAVGHLPDAGGLGTAYGSFFVASLIWCALSVPIRGFSVVGLFARYLRSPVISGMLVILTMVQISNVALPGWIGIRGVTPGFPVISFGAGLVAVLVLMTITAVGGRMIRRGAVLIALACGTICFAFFQPISLAAVANAPWLVTPQIFPFGFGVRADLVAIFLLTLVPAGMASMAMYQIVADWGHEKLTGTRMSEGVFAVALGSVLAGLVGGFSTLVYPDNVGMLRSTRVGSRFVTFSAGVLLIVLGACVKFDMLLVVVPQPVLAAAATLLFGIVMMHGIHMLAKVEWDDRQLMAAGLALLVGLGGMFVSPEALSVMPLYVRLFLAQPVISGGLVLVILHVVLCGDRLKQPVVTPAKA